MAYTLNIESGIDNTIRVSGNIERILGNRLATRFMKDYTQHIITDSHITFDILGNLEKTLERLNTIAGYAGCEIFFGENISQAVANYKMEEEKFHFFSQLALDIRNNNCNIIDFKTFKDSLESNLPARILYPLQMLSAYHLSFSQNGCNFSVPGAGKTSVVYGAYAYLKNLPVENVKHIDRLVIIGPLSCFAPWELEYEECFGVKATSKRLVGNVPLEEKKQYLYNDDPADITLLSYASVASIKDELQFFLSKHKAMVVLDEAHKIKNTKGGITAQAVLELAAKAKARIVLTGTPAPNGYVDLLNLFKFIWPTKDIIKFQAGQLKDMSKTSGDPRVKTLLDSIMPYFIRVRKSDLGITPPTEHPPIIVPMDNSQRKVYDFIEKRYVTELANNIDKRFVNSVSGAKVIRLMQVATNPTLLNMALSSFTELEGLDTTLLKEDTQFIREIMQYQELEIPSKFVKCAELVKTIISKGEKVIIWACYIRNIIDLQKYLEQEGIPARTLYGATPVAGDGMDEDDELYEFTREAIIKQFHEPYSPFKVIIANPFAVGESISLHKVCHNAIYLERSFNAAHFIQSKDRIHRYGLPEGTQTNYFYLVSENSIDETIHRRLKEKEERMLEIIESMPIPLFDNVTIEGGVEDIKAILNDYAQRTKKM